MPIWNRAGPPRRGPAIGRTLILDTWKGLQRARSWPRHKPRRPTLRQAARQQRLIQVTQTINRLIPREQIPMREALNRWNKRVRGQAGSAAIRYEDWQTARLYGSSWALQLPDGTVLHSQAMRQRVSDWLDWICDHEGAVLMRGPNSWDATMACESGARLVSTELWSSLGCCNLCSEEP